jgi:hypothetical protein
MQGNPINAPQMPILLDWYGVVLVKDLSKLTLCCQVAKCFLVILRLDYIYHK